MKNIEYKIGEIEGELNHIFLVTLEDNAFVFYANTWIREDLELIQAGEMFEKLIEKYNLKSDQVMGGGIVYGKANLYPPLKDPRFFQFMSSSSPSKKYGCVPREILSRFLPKLMPAYQKIDARLEYAQINIKPLRKIDVPREQEKWRKYVEN